MSFWRGGGAWLAFPSTLKIFFCQFLAFNPYFKNVELIQCTAVMPYISPYKTKLVEGVITFRHISGQKPA